MLTRADAATPWIQRLSGPRFSCTYPRTTKAWITPQIELNHHGRGCTSLQNWAFCSPAQIKIGAQCPWQIGQAGPCHYFQLTRFTLSNAEYVSTIHHLVVLRASGFRGNRGSGKDDLIISAEISSAGVLCYSHVGISRENLQTKCAC